MFWYTYQVRRATICGTSPSQPKSERGHGTSDSTKFTKKYKSINRSLSSANPRDHMSTRKLEAAWLHPKCILFEKLHPFIVRTHYRNNKISCYKLNTIILSLASLGPYYGLTKISFHLSNPSRYSQVSTWLASNELPPPRKRVNLWEYSCLGCHFWGVSIGVWWL